MSRSRRFWIINALILSAAVGVAAGIGNGPISGAVSGVGMLAFMAFLEFGRGERARALAAPGRGDEREVAIYNEATLVSYLAVVAVAVPGFLVGMAHGHYNQFGIVCSVGGGTQLLSALWLRTRR
jgi:hypothetical protein